jgi:RNA polymerase sigma-70 factor (ECF subfamily)
MNTHFACMVKDAFKLATTIVNNQSDAHDIIQDAAAIALSHKAAPKIDTDDFKPWFYKIVRNKSIDRLRSIQREQKRIDNDISDDIDSLASPYCDGQNPERQLVAQQQKSLINDALLRLRVQQREIVMLRDFHDFSYAHIAAILDIAPGSVMSRLHRARQALKEALKAPPNAICKRTKGDVHNEQ